MDTTTAQAIVAQAVVGRGYRNGWTAEQYAARQVAKMVEELGEMAEEFGCDNVGDMSLLVEGEWAKAWFDSDSDSNAWDGSLIRNPHAAYKELCDVVVVCLTMAGALSEIIGKPLDVVADAVAKATSDVGRGVR